MVTPPQATQRGLLEGVSLWMRDSGRRWDFLGAPWRFHRVIQFSDWQMCDGVLLSGAAPQIRAQAEHHGIPIVGTFASQDCPDIARVLPDSVAIGAMVARYFLGLGFRHFLYVGMEGRWFSQQRQEGFAAALASQGYDCRTVLMRHGAKRWAQSIQKLDQILKEARKPLAVMTCVDNQATVVLDRCHRLGLRVPGQVAVVGVDNDTAVCEFSQPAITSVDPSFAKVAFEAADLLERMMCGQTPPSEPLLVPPLGIEVRASSDILAVEDEIVCQAIRHIRQSSAEPINVDDVVKVVPLSRRPLEMRFLKATGRTIAQEIMAAHVDRAETLLANSDMSILEVAMASGFRSQQHLNEVIRRETGKPPTQYRRQRRLRRGPG